MQPDLLTLIEDLKRRIEMCDVCAEARGVKEWSGADVLIASTFDAAARKWLGDEPSLTGPQGVGPRRRVIITKYAGELSWLFYQLSDWLWGKIDYVSKCDLYCLLGQSAIDWLKNNEEIHDPKVLLLSVLDGAKDFRPNKTINFFLRSCCLWPV